LIFFFHFRESPRSFLSESRRSDSSNEELIEVGNNTKHGKIKRGLGKISNVFHRSPRKNQSPEVWSEEQFTTPRSNLRPLGEKMVSVNIVLDEDSKGETTENDNNNSPDCEEPVVEISIKSETDNVGKGHLRQKAKDIVKNAGRNALRKLSDKKLDKNSEEQLSRDDYEKDALSRCSDVSEEVSKESTLAVESSPISAQELPSTRGNILLSKSEVP
jgi:hypothetical protein